MNISRLMCNKSMPNSHVGNIIAWMGPKNAGMSIEIRACYNGSVWAYLLFADIRFVKGEPNVMPSSRLWSGANSSVPVAWTEVPT